MHVRENGHLSTVAFVCDDLMAGGWTSLASLILNLDPSRFRPYAICLFGKGANAEVLEERGIKVYCLNLCKMNLPVKLAEMIRILRRERTGIIHTNLHYSDVLGHTAAMLAGVRTRIIHLHSIKEKTGFEVRAWKRRLISRADIIVSVSDATTKYFNECHPGAETKIRKIPNGIDICEFRRRYDGSRLARTDLGVPADAFVSITVANFKWQKGYKYLVDAASMLPDPQVHFVVVGYGSGRREVEELAARKGLAERFHFLGLRTDVPELMKAADIFVLPSVVEPFGICILEAFAAGLPVVATAVDGIAETAEDMKTAVLVPPADPAKLADAIRRLKADTPLRSRLSAAASERVKDFDIAKIKARFEDAYAEACRKNAIR